MAKIVRPFGGQIADWVAGFFTEFEEIWGAIPGYAKVFFYSTISSVIGLLIENQFSWRSVVLILLTNLGLYQVPRSIGTRVKKLAGA